MRRLVPRVLENVVRYGALFGVLFRSPNSHAPTCTARPGECCPVRRSLWSSFSLTEFPCADLYRASWRMLSGTALSLEFFFAHRIPMRRLVPRVLENVVRYGALFGVLF